MSDSKIQLIVSALDKATAVFNDVKKQLSEMSGGIKAADSSCKELSSTFLNLKTVLAGAFATAGVRQLVGTFMEYNKTLETTRLGIAAIVTSMAEVKDSQGRTLQGAEKFQAAQQVAVSVQKELQSIAMVTAVTYQELLQVYQGILAPALQAKMTMSQTAEIAGILANSVKAVGLPLNQILQESRDLIAGTIDQNSFLAKSLGITTDMSKEWKSTGKTFDELKKRLEGFIYASNEFSNTWEGAWSNLKDAAQKALGEGFQPVFARLKKEVIDLSTSFLNITKDQNGKIIDIQIKDEIRDKLRKIGAVVIELIDALKKAIEISGKLWDAIGKEALIAGIALGLGKIALCFADIATKIGLATIAARAFKATAIGLFIEGGVMVGKKIYDDKQAAAMTERIKESVQGALPADRREDISKSYNLAHLTGGHIQKIMEQYPGLSEADISKGITSGAIKIKAPEVIIGFNGSKSWSNANLDFDKKALEKILAGDDTSKADVTGKKTQTDEQKKKLLEEKKEALKLKLERLKEEESLDRANIKLRESANELAFKRGEKSQEDFENAKLTLKKNAVETSITYNDKEMDAINESWEKEQQGLIKYDEFKKEKLAKELEISKREGDTALKKIELQILDNQGTEKGIELANKLSEAEREGALKTLEARLDLQKELSAYKLERREMTNAEAMQAEISGEKEKLRLQLANLVAKNEEGLADDEKKKNTNEILVLTGKLLNFESERYRMIEAKEKDLILEKDQKIAITERQLETAKLNGETQKELDLELQLLSLRKERALLDKGLTETEKESIRKKYEADKKPLEAMQAPNSSFAQGLKDAIKGWEDTSKQMYNIARETAQAMSQSFSDFFFDSMQGKLKSLGDYVKSFTASVQRSVANMMGQQVTSGLISGASKLFGFADGGVMTSFGPLPLRRYAAGGIAYTPQLAMFGEGSRPEAYVPLPDGRHIPAVVDFKGMWDGINTSRNSERPQEVHNHYYIQAVDAKSFADLVERNPGAIAGVVQQAQRDRVLR